MANVPCGANIVRIIVRWDKAVETQRPKPVEFVVHRFHCCWFGIGPMAMRSIGKSHRERRKYIFSWSNFMLRTFRYQRLYGSAPLASSIFCSSTHTRTHAHEGIHVAAYSPRSIRWKPKLREREKSKAWGNRWPVCAEFDGFVSAWLQSSDS